MSVADGGGRFFDARFVVPGVLIALLLSLAAPGQAEPANPPSSSVLDGTQSMEELRVHASTIADILDAASERVDRLAADDAASPALMNAIRQELSLSRRWNHHLGTILDEVTEARRALGLREREAAREITRLTVAAEEARQELIALRKVLKAPRDQPGQHGEAWPEGSLDDTVSGDHAARTATRLEVREASAEHDDSARAWESRALDDVRAMLTTMQESQKSAVRDVDAVRAKIIEALQTLNGVRGDLPMKAPGDGAALSSEDITAWAATMALRLGRTGRMDME